MKGAAADGDALTNATEAAGATAACEPDLEPTAGRRKLRQQAAAPTRLPAEPDDVVGSMVRRIFAAAIAGAGGGTAGRPLVPRSTEAVAEPTATATKPAVGEKRKRAADEISDLDAAKLVRLHAAPAHAQVTDAAVAEHHKITT